MSKTLKFLIYLAAIVFLLPLIVVLFVALLSVANNVAHADEGKVARTTELRHRDKTLSYDCHHHTWSTGWATTLTDVNRAAMVRMKAHVCTWTKHSSHARGQIIQKKTHTTENWVQTGFGQTIGLNFWQHDKYRTNCNGFDPNPSTSECNPLNPWEESMGFWNQERQCRSICLPTGNFVTAWRYISPYLVRHSPNMGPKDVWDFSWWEGQPGQSPSNADKAVKWMCWCW